LTASAHGLAGLLGNGGPTFWPEARKDFGLEGEEYPAWDSSMWGPNQHRQLARKVKEIQWMIKVAWIEK